MRQPTFDECEEDFDHDADDFDEMQEEDEDDDDDDLDGFVVPDDAELSDQVAREADRKRPRTDDHQSANKKRRLKKRSLSIDCSDDE